MKKTLTALAVAAAAAMGTLLFATSNTGCYGGCQHPGTCLCADNSHADVVHFPCDCAEACSAHGVECGAQLESSQFSDGGCSVRSSDGGSGDGSSGDGG